MRGYDVSFDEPAQNLACDEALLIAAESGGGTVLRFWESPRPFVVLGVSQQAAREANLDACRRDDVPVLRRCSAGGCVLQGPGCLNYSLILDMQSDPALATIRSSYCHILTRIRDALRQLGVEAALEGTSDLAVAGVKFSGNAQRRKRRFLLHHGTLLYGMDLTLVSTYLAEPLERPAYRGSRPHEGFVGNLPLSREVLMDAILGLFPVDGFDPTMDAAVLDSAERLSNEKYRLETWNLRR